MKNLELTTEEAINYLKENVKILLNPWQFSTFRPETNLNI